MNKLAAVIAVIAGAILSGQCAIWGACLGGHDPNAGYPFPDFKGAVLFLIGVSVIPIVVAVFTTIVRRFLSARLLSFRIPIPVAVLLFGPLFSLAMGYSVQARDNRTKDHEEKYYAQQKEAYSRFAAQLTADPSIVFRERWFERKLEIQHGADVSARQMVFKDSFQPSHMAVAYTGEQLREISERAQENRLFVVCHPMCPPDLLEALWPLVFGGFFLLKNKDVRRRRNS